MAELTSDGEERVPRAIPSGDPFELAPDLEESLRVAVERMKGEVVEDYRQLAGNLDALADRHDDLLLRGAAHRLRMLADEVEG